jgi:nickel-dependent lactate racemase
MSDRAGAFASSQVIFTEKKSPARVIHFGESFLEESLPVGTRVIYSKPPMTAVPLPKEAIRHALNHPVGECEPLFAQLRPGMRVTIALDDISLPLPSMTRPDIRQMILEEVLTTLHHCGVDDVHIIIARSFHRRMKPWEIRHAVGDEIFQMYYPKRLYDHDGEDHENMVVLGTTEHGEHAHINRRAAESDLLIYVNINLVPMDGGHKSVGVGLSGYKGLRAHHNAQTIRKTSTYMDPENSAMHQSTNRVGRIVEEHIKIFHIETAVNTQMYQPHADAEQPADHRRQHDSILTAGGAHAPLVAFFRQAGLHARAFCL